MGYMMVIAPCYVCKRPFMSNPDYVPSVRVNAQGQPDPQGTREPVCRDCVEEANAKRVELGMEPHPIHPEAYKPQEVQ
jgi:hypothetical protein